MDGFTVHSYNQGELMACFDENISETLVEYFAEKKPSKVIFRDDSFSDSSVKINIEERLKRKTPDTRIKVL